MILYKVIPILIVCSCLPHSAPAQEAFPSPSTIPRSATVEHTQDFSEIVVPITSVKITPSAKLGITGKLGPKLDLGATFGTGFCLDAACRFIATNYHVAVSARVHKIKGEKVVQRFLATGPDDKDATANDVPNGDVLAFAMKRDLAIFELRRSLSHHHGLTFSLDELQIGQEVDIYGYPKGIINPIRKLTRFPATFKAPTTSGLLAFEYQLSSDKPIRIQGASGGIVVDRKTEKILGILSGTNETTAVAVPVQTLADFVTKVQPFLAQRIFPTTKDVSPVSADLYPKFQPPPDLFAGFVPSYTGVLQHRPEEPYEVTVLREKAQLLADSIRNFIAVQSFAWGSGNGEPNAEAEYEVRIVDGDQRFRSYPEGKKEVEEIPYPPIKGWALGADEWSKLPKMVGTEYRLKIQEAADSIMNRGRVKVFQYRSSVEDNLCPFRPMTYYGLFWAGRTVEVACYGEVWTDENTNIIRISEHLDLSDKLKAYKGWNDYEIVITYGLIKIGDEPSRPAPLTIFTQGRNGKKIYWCRGQFTNYRIFDSRVKIVAGDYVQSLPP
jgi:hypothetical protein